MTSFTKTFAAVLLAGLVLLVVVAGWQYYELESARRAHADRLLALAQAEADQALERSRKLGAALRAQIDTMRAGCTDEATQKKLEVDKRRKAATLDLNRLKERHQSQAEWLTQTIESAVTKDPSLGSPEWWVRYIQKRERIGLAPPSGMDYKQSRNYVGLASSVNHYIGSWDDSERLARSDLSAVEAQLNGARRGCQEAELWLTNTRAEELLARDDSEGYTFLFKAIKAGSPVPPLLRIPKKDLPI